MFFLIFLLRVVEVFDFFVILSVQTCISHFRKLRRKICGSSSVGRALASQAKGHGFESRLPLRVEASNSDSCCSFFLRMCVQASLPPSSKITGLSAPRLCSDKGCFGRVAGINRYLIFRGIPASPSLRLAVESRLPLRLEASNSNSCCSFF